MRRVAALMLLLVLLFALVAPTAALAEGVTAQAGASRSANNRYFPLTGHNVSGAFLSFFDSHGGIDTFGLPRTDAFEENGRLVQYFQRHRMEWWPENPPAWQVQLALIGDLVLPQADPPAPKPADPSSQYFPQTGHSVGPPFRDYFSSHGGLAIFGYPTSEAYNLGAVLVQRFQRARLEYRPENPPAFRVQPGLLGDEYIFNLKRVPLERTQPVPEGAAPDGWVLWGSWTTPTAGFLPFKLQNSEVAMKALDGTVLAPGEVYRFSKVLSAPGYVRGLGYGADNQWRWMNAGGTCGAATTFYRAIYNAGLQILEVHPHTLVSYDPPGWDATVGDYLDVVIRNDTPGELRLRGRLDRQAGRMMVWVEGRQLPDRTVTRRGPNHLAEFTYEVFRDIVYQDGRQTHERREITYAGNPPPLPADLSKIPQQ